MELLKLMFLDKIMLILYFFLVGRKKEKNISTQITMRITSTSKCMWVGVFVCLEGGGGGSESYFA